MRGFIRQFFTFVYIETSAEKYERQERKGVLFTLKDGVQLFLKDRFYCSKADFSSRKAGFTLRKADFLLKGRKGGMCFSL